MTSETRGRRPAALTGSTMTAPPAVGLTHAPITALWVPALGVDVPLPALATFTIGRTGAHVTVPHGSVSRLHAQVERDGDSLRLHDAGSKNGITVDDVRVSMTTIRAAQLGVKLGQVVVFPLTQAQVAARQVLAHYLGHGPEADALVQRLIADAAASRSFVVLGPAVSEPMRVVDALIAASPRRATNRVDVTERHRPTGLAIRDLAANLRGGVVTVDLAAIRDARDGRKRPEAPVWASTLAHPQWELLTCWYGDDESALRPLGGAWPVSPTTVTIPTVGSRATAGEFPLLVDYLLRAGGVGFTARDLARVELPIEALARHPWPDGHAELRTCINYAIALLGGGSHRDAARTLGVDRTTLARMVKAWRGER